MVCQLSGEVIVDSGKLEDVSDEGGLDGFPMFDEVGFGGDCCYVSVLKEWTDIGIEKANQGLVGWAICCVVECFEFSAAVFGFGCYG